MRSRVWAGLILALASCLLSIALRRLLDRIFPVGFPFMMFFPSVMVTTYFAGTLPGLACTGLCTVAVWYLFTQPYNSFALDTGTALALVLFVLVAGLIVQVISHMRVVSERLDTERRKSTQLYERERVLFQELQHRVANNMQFVASLLHLQRQHMPDDATDAARALDEASRRIQVMARVHRRLYDATAADTLLGAYLAEVLGEVIDASGVTGITCKFDVFPVRFDIDRLMLLSLITTEVVTNCLKHAFGGRSDGTILIELHRLGATELELTITDDGCGIAAGDQSPKAGLGTRILKGLATQLGGQISMTSNAGTITRLRFPLRDAQIASD
ncbi:DUF4118 domain-containing protein [Polymorphobacter sp. PAMC 29334]|uniref:histidine kinase dimerization/phosphoacceptor domain -containing protein n=1 Tax=Polymorphobacter sp. PAMC 29334 TaxID=2862331 RepID=UPI001C76A98A|nr:histidine kinase dimerization/phosphoacceptor domain -containing protein [Polymorphobacter sp. PAMC 29334]QYE36480.1 DUF4118 domain-containing protein [Polymorphobacter sp. PAMC 29334]